MKITTWAIWVFNAAILAVCAVMNFKRIPIDAQFVLIIGIIEGAIGGTKIVEKLFPNGVGGTKKETTEP
jgi:hypothetical protein